VKIKAGIAEGQPLVEEEALIDTARSREDAVIRLQCP
jgi:hypothetical protein